LRETVGGVGPVVDRLEDALESGVAFRLCIVGDDLNALVFEKMFTRRLSSSFADSKAVRERPGG
jgi:hypothetical protein